MEKISKTEVQKAEKDPVKEHARKILDCLGLTMGDLREKKVLDLGAGDADLAKAAKEEGTNIISLSLDEPEEKQAGIDYARGDGMRAPFGDGSFDLVVSHAAPPTLRIEGSRDNIKATIDEVTRLLKPGGEFRFGPLGIDASVFDDRELFTKEEESFFDTNQRIERIKEKSLELLKSIDSNIEQSSNDSGGFYILKK